MPIAKTIQSLPTTPFSNLPPYDANDWPSQWNFIDWHVQVNQILHEEGLWNSFIEKANAGENPSQTIEFMSLNNIYRYAELNRQHGLSRCLEKKLFDLLIHVGCVGWKKSLKSFYQHLHTPNQTCS